MFLEAAATGKPVIGGNSGGVPEAIERGVTGLLVEGAEARSVAAGHPRARHVGGDAPPHGCGGPPARAVLLPLGTRCEAVSQLHARLMLRAS